MRAIQRFEVSLKAFILNANGSALFVREADTGFWELPGGRIDVGEEWCKHADVLAREIREELGHEIEVAFGDAAITWTRRRPTDGVFTFIVGRQCRHVAGDPTLSSEHDELGWHDARSSRQLRFPAESGYIDALARLWQLA
jgi:8-oxo-dGTP pyrophosphatase MutT (NUDIX family)